MAVTLGNDIKLTSDAEKIFVELGGADPNETLTKQALSEALVNAITTLADKKSPYLLKLYKYMEAEGSVPPLDSIIECDDDS